MSPWHWLIVIGVFALLFGAKRLPDAARSIGRSTRILKSELSGLRSDEPVPAETATAEPAAEPAAAPTATTEKATPQAASS